LFVEVVRGGRGDGGTEKNGKKAKHQVFLFYRAAKCT
jgi:hypothetical protein